MPEQVDLSEYGGRLYASSDPESATGNPFHDAAIFANNTSDFVEASFKYLKDHIIGGTSADAMTSFTNAMLRLEEFDFLLPELGDIKPEVNWQVDVDFDLPPVDASDFGNMTPWELDNAPAIGNLPNISTVSIPSFVPSIASLHIPDAPDPSNIPDPGDAPLSPGFTFPDEPVITLPDKPLLSKITLPAQPNITIPTLEDMTYPDLDEMNIQTYIQWSEPEYSPEIWTDVKAQLLAFFAGGSGIRPEIEESMVARGRDREDRLVRQGEQQAMEEWAGRGFTAPPGMLAKRLDNIREEGLIKKLGLQREVVIKAMDEELANIRLAVQQGIVAEQLFIQIHLAAVERLFMIERLHVEWEIQKYNLLVQAFQAKFQENLIRAQVYEIRVRAALAEIEVFKALIDAEIAKAEINKSLVQAYTAEVEARESLVNLYKAQVEAVAIQAGVFETEVRAYGEEVSAFAQRVNADKLRFDAYDSRVRGEVAKADIIRSEAQAYSAEIQGIETGVRAETAALEGYVSGFEAEVSAYEAGLRGLLGKNEAELNQIRANVAGYQADTQRFVASASAEEAKSRVELAAWDAEARMTIAWYDAQIAEYRARVDAILGQKDRLLEAIKASGSLASTIGAGALAAMHAGASINGSGSISATGGDSSTFGQSWSKTCATGHSVSINVEQDSDPGTKCSF